ncbi:MAG: methylmalonyl-CoA mutase small subunit, partial [Chlorobiales bacterium]|nr:methylmalonyl-CoA mutase small subunit [Chlorobiales bacterium]
MSTEKHTPVEEPLFASFPPISKEAWEAQILKDLKGADYEKKLVWQTIEGFKVKPYYTADDLTPLGHLQTPPGEAPFIRGTNRTTNDWRIRQDIEVKEIASANQTALEAIAGGATDIGFVLSGGNSIKQTDLSALLQGIDLAAVAIHFSANSCDLKLVDEFLAEAVRRGVSGEALAGSIDYDPLGQTALTGEENSERVDCLKEIARDIESLKDFPKLKTLTVSSEPYHNAGATAVQELAITLAVANEYLSRLTDLGLSVEEITPRMQFSFAIGSNYFMEIAKLRAARLLWSQLVSAYNPSSSNVAKMHIHAVTSSWNMTVYDPYVNMLRATTEAMSAAVGGAEVLTVRPFDAIYKTPDTFSCRIARNVQHLLKGESHLDKIVDPASGSYLLESLTDTVARETWKAFQDIEAAGGFMAALRSGKIQKEIEAIRQKREENQATRKEILLGVSQYPNLTEKMADKIGKPESALASVGKIEPLKPYRSASAFESVRLATEKFANKSGGTPKVFLLPTGDLAMRNARAIFSSNFFGCAGFEIVLPQPFETAEDGAVAVAKSGAEIVVICSSDEDYKTAAPTVCAALKAKGSKAIVIVAGYPKEIVEELKAAGVSDFIHIRSNVLETLKKYQV